MKYVKDLTKIRLKSDCKSEPSEYEGLTLGQFCIDHDIPQDTPINVVDAFLIANDLQPIDEQPNYVEEIESKLESYMGANEKVCLDKKETIKFFNDIIEGFFTNYDVLETDLDHLYDINEKLWEVALNKEEE